MRISALSLEYVRVKVAATEDGAAVDLSASTVVMAFVAEGAAPVSGDWKSGSWETDPTTTPDTYYARCLVGPGGAVTLTAGVYDVWVEVTDSPETPVLRAGNVEVF
ncbi:MAG: hypothetical protein IT340_21470 [Chloroflexi bacterium]|nr:hypothetical protein [Chloroflexota bacterium]